MEKQPKILIADDDSVIVAATRRILESAGYETLGAQDGLEALELTRAQRPDLILLDVTMPKMDGFEVCRQIKADPTLAGIFIIIMSSARTDIDSQVDGLNMGADGYLARPIANRELLARVEAMLRIQAAEKALRMSEQKYRQLIAQASDGIFVIDSNGMFILANSKACEMLGYSEQELLRTDILDTYPPELVSVGKQRMEALRAGEHLRFERTMRRKDGSVFLIEATAEVLDNGSVQSIIRDITERKQAEQALRESEDKFKYVFDHSVIGKSITLPSGELNVNQAFCDILGYSQDELKNRKWQEISHPEDIELTQTEINSLLFSKRETTRFIKRYLHKNGSIIWAEVGTALRRDPDGKPLYFLTSVNDITARKQAEQALYESENRYRRITEGLTDYQYSVRVENGRPVETIQNPNCENVTGYTAEEFAADPYLWFNMIAPEERELVSERVQQILAGREIPPIEHRIRRKDGEMRWVSDTAILFKDASGNLVLYDGVIKDITERKQAGETLRETSERLAHMLANSPTVIYALKVEGEGINPIWISDNIESVLGFSTEDGLKPEWWQGQIYPPDRPGALAALEHLLDDFYQHEYRFLRKDGRLIWLHDEHRLLRDADNQPWEIIGAWTDITARKQAEEALKEYNARLETAVEARTHELREAQEQLVRQEKLAVLGQLAGSVGHELRNPLGIINNAIYYLRMVQPDADATIKEYLEIIETETHTADKIISDLLDFSRIKSVDVEPVAVSDLIQRTLERFPTPENVQVRLNLPENLPKIFVDPRQMVQVLGNLVVNACQAMTSPSLRGQASSTSALVETKLTISAALEGDTMKIVVQDTGVGISSENMNKLFEPLFTTKPKGIGLGLAVSKKLVEANGGRIEVESEPGKGSVFTVYLPVSKELE